jgi:dCTP deaminase
MEFSVMNTARDTLFSTSDTNQNQLPSGPGGILPGQALQDLIEAGREIVANTPIEPGQIQPASLDLRLGKRAFRVRASFLPGEKATVQQKIDQLAMHAFELGDDGTVLEKGCVYIVELVERLALEIGTNAIANPKSSIGRIDVFTRLITDYGTAFDKVCADYNGPLYAEISPRTFSILVREGDRLNQIRLKRSGAMRTARQQQEADDWPLEDGVPVTVDLDGGAHGAGIVGYRARKHAGLIDLRKLGHYDVADFWHPLRAKRDKILVLDPDEFYILASNESVRIPPDQAAEMLAYDTSIGEFRVHYAGFFDPGFGHGEADGTRAVLEVRSHEVPFVLEHGQRVGRLIYEPMAATPNQLYGSGIGSNYQHQGLRLSKHFAVDH